MNQEPCSCDQMDPNDPPCGSEECGGQDAVDAWFAEAEQDAEEKGDDPLEIRSVYGHLASWH